MQLLGEQARGRKVHRGKVERCGGAIGEQAPDQALVLRLGGRQVNMPVLPRVGVVVQPRHERLVRGGA